jgi:CRISPR-associated endoribonuclease Cas6
MQMSVRIQQQTPRSVSYDHNYPLGSAMYEALRAFHPDLAREMHQSPERAKLAVGEIYHLPRQRGEAVFRVSSPDERLLRLLGGALVATGKLHVGQAVYAVEGTQVHPTPDLAAPTGVHTLSPVLIRGRGEDRRSLVHDNCEYTKVLAEVINHDVKRATGREGTVQVLRMDKLDVRKRTLAGRTVMAQKGTFWLDGDSRDLQHVLDWGIGHSTGLGFGMVVEETGGHP